MKRLTLAAAFLFGAFLLVGCGQSEPTKAPAPKAAEPKKCECTDCGCTGCCDLCGCKGKKPACGTKDKCGTKEPAADPAAK